MKLLITASVCVGLLTATTLGSKAFASALGLPAADFLEQVESDTLIPGGLLEVQHGSTGGMLTYDQPPITAYAISSGYSGGSASTYVYNGYADDKFDFNAAALISYNIEISSSKNTTIPIDISTLLETRPGGDVNIDVYDGTHDYFAELDAIGPTATFTVAQDEITTTYKSLPNTYTLENIFYMMNLPTNTVIYISEYSGAQTSNFYGTSEAQSSIDPTFGIDPSVEDASKYSIEYSSGIIPGPAPEPSSWILLLIGSWSTGLALRRASLACRLPV